MEFHYTVQSTWSDEDEGYVAVVPELPGVEAFGATLDEAAREVQEASEAYVRELSARGRPVSGPWKRPEFSGQLRLRMPSRLHAQLHQIAALEGVSLNQLLVAFLAEAVGAYGGRRVLAAPPGGPASLVVHDGGRSDDVRSEASGVQL